MSTQHSRDAGRRLEGSYAGLLAMPSQLSKQKHRTQPTFWWEYREDQVKGFCMERLSEQEDSF